jgi:hypothetical protein
LVPDGNFRIHAELMGAPNFKALFSVILAKEPAGGFRSIFPTPAQTARSIMRIRDQLFVASAVAFTLCLALPAEAAKKKKQRSAATAAYSTSYAAAPRTWSAAGSGPLYNGPDYLGQDPDINIRAYILKDLGLRYGGGGGP